jgi:hypothetical protein
MTTGDDLKAGDWPALPFAEWQGTAATLHMWMQIVGKIRVACASWVNHQWHITFHLTSRGVTSRPIPWEGRTFQIDFDFVDHKVLILVSDGWKDQLDLRPRSVAEFYHELMAKLERVGVAVEIHGVPNEVPDPIPFRDNEREGDYQPEYANRFWRILSSSCLVFDEFRGGFIGKCSPVHFFWGAMDLAVTRFSGARAPAHPGGIPHLPDWITREAYSHEVSSAGFWAGSESHPQPIFYSYAYPSPPGFSEARVGPPAARWDSDLMEFILPYDQVRTGRSPREDLLEFLESTYVAAAELGDWDREQLEWKPGERPPAGGFDRERQRSGAEIPLDVKSKGA